MITTSWIRNRVSVPSLVLHHLNLILLTIRRLPPVALAAPGHGPEVHLSLEVLGAAYARAPALFSATPIC
jgi:hypothetical protein